MELASHMVNHGNMCGPLLRLSMKLSPHGQESILAVHVFIQPFRESSLTLLVMIIAVKLAVGQELRDTTTLTTLSGMVRGVRGRISAVTEEDMVLYKQLPQPTQDDIDMRVYTNSVEPDEDIVLEQIELYIQ